MRDSLYSERIHCMVLNTIQDHILSCMRALGVMVFVAEEENHMAEMVLFCAKENGPEVTQSLRLVLPFLIQLISFPQLPLSLFLFVLARRVVLPTHHSCCSRFLD